MPATPATWLEEFDSNTSGATSDPQVIQLSNGNILVAYETADNSGAGSTGGIDILGQLYDPAGNPLGEEVRLNRLFNGGDEHEFDIAALDDGTFVIVFEAFSPVTGITAIRAERHSIDENGVTALQPVTIVESTDGSFPQGPTVESTGNGGYTVGYGLVDTNLGTQDFLRQSVDVNGVLSAPSTGIFDSDPSIDSLVFAQFANGSTISVGPASPGDTDLIFNIFTDGGQIANVGTNVITGEAADPAVALLANDTAVITYTRLDGEFPSVEFMIVDEVGRILAQDVSVGALQGGPGQADPAIATLPDGGFIIFYSNVSDAVRGQRFDTDGNAVGEDFLVSVQDGVNIGATTLADGRVVVTFTDQFGNASVQIVDVRDDAGAQTFYEPVPVFVGTAGNDTFTAPEDALIVAGGGGEDNITTHGGIAEYYGGDGRDNIFVTTKIDGDLYDAGSGGNNAIIWENSGVEGAVFDLQAGTATNADGDTEIMRGFTRIIATEFADTVIGTDGGDGLRGRDGDDDISGGGGNDSLFGEDGNDTVRGGAGNDEVNGNAGDDKLFGQDGDDTLNGDGGNDELTGGAGDDTMFGGTGDDKLTGGQGDDTMSGGEGVDVIRGGGGKDFAAGGDGNDRIFGDDGDDNFTGDNGSDIIRGGLGNDELSGGSGADRLFGEAGDDILDGESGQDILKGGGGNDRLDGGDNSDVLFGDSGEDELNGGAARDTLDGGRGNDMLTGGTEADTFIFLASWGIDVITDFSSDDAEQIDLSAINAITDFDDLLNNHLFDAGGTAEIRAGDNAILLTGVAFVDVGAGLDYSEADFLF